MLNMSRSCAPAARNASHLTFQILVVGLVKFMFEQHLDQFPYNKNRNHPSLWLVPSFAVRVAALPCQSSCPRIPVDLRSPGVDQHQEQVRPDPGPGPGEGVHAQVVLLLNS